MGQKVLVFGDIGIDDTLALIYGYLNDDIDIVGVVADYGNISREHALANVRYVKNLLQVPKDFLIMGGAEVPMTGESPEFFPEIHGEYGLGPIIPPYVEGDGVIENFFEVINIIKKYHEDLLIVNIGRLTSLATLFILYRELMTTVKGYYILGGAFWVPGNATAVSEANFYGDPAAVKVVLKYANNVSIIPLNVTQKAFVTPEMIDYIDRVGNIQIIKPLYDYYYAFYKKRTPNLQGSPVHDILALMATIHEEMFTYYTLPVFIDVQLNKITTGQSIADIRPFVDKESNNEKKFQIALDINYEQFFYDFMDVMTRKL